MAKKKTGKIIQILSPENYIRKKARTLPIYECLVNKEWKEQGAAHVVVARKHVNGHITFCIYLIDLFCLGIKDTHYFFNISELEYQEKKEEMEELEPEPISYNLAHNIIFAGLRYAAEYGFKPHKDFTSITQYMLDEDNEDTEDIEFIDIECGKDGQPFFVSGPYDDEVKINQILTHLEKTAGIGNYDYLIEDEDLEDVDEISHLSIKELRDIFTSLSNKEDDLTVEEYEQLQDITDHIIDSIVSPDLVDRYCEEYLDDFDFEVTDDVFTEEMLGITNQKLSVGTCELFAQIHETAIENPGQARLLLNDFRKETPENPAAYFLELIILRAEKSTEFELKVQEYYTRFPEYSLLKILISSIHFSEESTNPDASVKAFTMKSLFKGRTWIHHIEAFQYLISLVIGLTCLGDINYIQGFYEAYNNLELTDYEFEILDEFIYTVQHSIVEHVLSMEEHS